MTGLVSALAAVCALAQTPDSPTASAEARKELSAAPRANYFVIVTGGELLHGVYPDGHTYFLTRTLDPLGCRCVGSMCVDDRAEEMTRALEFARASADLILVTGGLGPTANDITREVLSAFTGIALREDPESIAVLERRFQRRGEALRANLRRQTLVPERGTWLANRRGTAVGLVFEPEGYVVVALPGPPSELQPMVEAELLPYLERRFGIRSLGASRTLRFVGIGQSQIDQVITDQVKLPPEVVVTSLFDGRRVDFTFWLPGDSAEDHVRLQELETRILEHLGEFFYGNGGTSLEAHVLGRLAAAGGSLALVEAATGGLLAANLQEAAGAEDLLLGAWLAPSERRLGEVLGVDETDAAQAASASSLKSLASAVQGRYPRAWIVAVGEAAPDESGSVGVWTGLMAPGGAWQAFRLGGSGGDRAARQDLATRILDQVRRRLPPAGNDRLR